MLVDSSLTTNPISTQLIAGWTVYLETGMRTIKLECFENLLKKIACSKLSDIVLRDEWDSFFSQIKGSFFFFAIHPDKLLILFANDALARLPVYLYKNKDALYIGRDIGLAHALCPSMTLNPLYLALYQIFCYVPGRGACYDEIDTLQGASLSVYNWGTDEFIQSSDASLRFITPERMGNKKTRLKELEDAFTEVLEEYQCSGELLLALSGGFDSRAVGAALTRKAIPYKSVTYMDVDKTATDDLVIARQLSVALNSPHEIINLNPENEVLYQQLYAMKGGMNYLGMSFFLEFLQCLVSSSVGDSILITGDGGDKVLLNLIPEINLMNERSVLNLIYEKNAFFTPDLVAAIFGLKQAHLDEYLLALIDSYPGRSHGEKYKCFLLAERSGRWLFEGEDRNRYYIRSETPFLDYRFFTKAMMIPDEWKKGNAFYSMFIQALLPAANKVRLADGRLAPRYLSSQTLQTMLAFSRRVRSLKPLRRNGIPTMPDFHMRNWIIDRLVDSSGHPEVSRYIRNADLYGNRNYLSTLNRAQLNIMLTLSSMISGGV